MIGKVIGQYRILAEIARGSMGIVFRAEDTQLQRLVALKIIAEKLVNDPQMLHRFQQEGEAASRLRHPNICRVYGSGEWQGRPYLAMELLEGQTLDQRLTAGTIPGPQLLEIAIGVASALEATHAIGVIHRDIKPENLFLTTGGIVKVLDFGLAKVRVPQRTISQEATTAAMHVTTRGTLIGTVAYMSPEQIRCEALDGRADLYSLGVALYELATGQLPIYGSHRNAKLPGGLGPIVTKLTAPDPTNRFQTARELINVLRLAVPGREAFERHAL
jgi:serine/threonine protein kinase